MLAHSRCRSQRRVQVGALSSDAATAVGVGVALLGGAAAFGLWRIGQPVAALIAGLGTLAAAPKIAAATA